MERFVLTVRHFDHRCPLPGHFPQQVSFTETDLKTEVPLILYLNFAPGGQLAAGLLAKASLCTLRVKSLEK